MLINSRKRNLGALELAQDEAHKGYMRDICHASRSWGKNISHMRLLLQLTAEASCPSWLSGASVSSLWGLLVLSKNPEHFLSSERAKKATEWQGSTTAVASRHQSASVKDRSCIVCGKLDKSYRAIVQTSEQIWPIWHFIWITMYTIKDLVVLLCYWAWLLCLTYVRPMSGIHPEYTTKLLGFGKC